MLDEDHLYTDEISSHIAAHLVDFYDDGGGGDLFAAANATSDIFTPFSEDTSSSSTTTPPGHCNQGDNTSVVAASSAFSPMPFFKNSILSALIKDQNEPAADDDEIILPVEYQYQAAVSMEPLLEQQEQFDQLAVALPAEHPAIQTQMSSMACELVQLASSGYSDDCFAAAMGGAAGGYMGLDETLCHPPLDSSLLSAGVAEAAMQGGCFFGKEAAQGGFIGAGCTGMVMPMIGMDEIGEYQRMMEDAGAGALAGVTTHSPDAESVAAAPMPFGGNAGEMQMSMSGSMSPERLPAETTSCLEDPNLKGARISVEERREKIRRYIKKRNERNFSKKIKYACRKTLADSRPRVRGRFAKNDDYGETWAMTMQNHEEYENMAGMKGEDMLDSNVLQAQLIEMNSYTYNHHALESWI